MYYHITKLLLLVDHITFKAVNTIVLTALIYSILFNVLNVLLKYLIISIFQSYKSYIFNNINFSTLVSFPPFTSQKIFANESIPNFSIALQ